MITCSMKSLLSDSFAGEWGSETGDVLTPVLRTANFNGDGSLDYDSPAYRCIPEKKVRAKRMRRGDVILEKSGGTPNRPVGIMAYYDSDDEALCSNFNHILRFDDSAVNSFFMFHQLRWLRERGAFAPYTRKTTGLQNLQMKAFVDLELTVPPKAEQDKAAIAIRAIDAERNELKGLLKNLDGLVKSRFVEMFGDPLASCDWPTLTIGDMCLKARTGPFGSALLHSEFVDEGVFVLGIDNAVDNRFSYKRMRYITEEKYEQLRRYTVEPLDVIITIMGTVGRSAVVPEGIPKAINTKHLACLTTNREIVNPYFLCEAFQSHPEIQRQLSRSKKGAIMDGLNLTIIKGLSFALPPLSLQNQFVEFMQQVDKLKFETQRAIEKLQMLYDSLAQEYFGGE